MNQEHNKIEEQIKNSLETYGTILVEPIISIEFGSRRYRPDLIFKNTNTNKKVIIEIKSNQMGFTLSATSYIVELKNYLDNHSEYKFVLILTNDLTPNISKYIKGRVTYFSLQEKKLDEISKEIVKMTE